MSMESGSIEREIHVEASPEIVFEVVSRPEHIREWWGGAETDLAAAPGAVSEIAWGRGTDDPHLELVPSGNGTLIRMSETGFREKGWEIAALEAAYADHVRGWDLFVPNLGDHVTRLVSTP